MQSWCRTWPPNGPSHIRARQKLLRKHKGACKNSWSQIGNLKSFTLTIPWNLEKLVKISPGTIARLHHTDQKQMGLLQEQYACCNQVWMKIGGQVPWNVIPICETSQINYLMGRLHTKDVLENLIKDRSFRLVHWLSITLSLQRTSQESINLARKSYLDCSSDTHLYTGGIWNGDILVCRLWGVGDDGRIWKSTRKDPMRKRWYFPKKKENIFQSQMDDSPLEEIRTWEHPAWYGIDQLKERVILTFKENQKGLFHNLKTHFRMPVKR